MDFPRIVRERTHWPDSPRRWYRQLNESCLRYAVPLGRLHSRFQPILYQYARDSFKVPDLSCHNGKTAGQCYRSNSKVGIAYRRSSPFQLWPYLTITTCGSLIEWKHRQIGRKCPVQPFQEQAGTCLEPVCPVSQLPQCDAGSKTGVRAAPTPTWQSMPPRAVVSGGCSGYLYLAGC